MRTPLDQLAAEVTAAGITRPELEGILYKLSPSQRRLFLRLARGPADTIELRTACSIGNISEASAELNAKLQVAKDPRRVSCTLKTHRNAYRDNGVLGVWTLAIPKGAA